MARQPLGRGLSALMGEEKPQAAEAGTREVDIDLIEPNPEQPRTRFAEEKLAELAASIRANGVVQPIVLRPMGSRYQIVAVDHIDRFDRRTCRTRTECGGRGHEREVRVAGGERGERGCFGRDAELFRGLGEHRAGAQRTRQQSDGGASRHEEEERADERAHGRILPPR